MAETRDFHLGDILTVITDRFVTPNGVGGVYEILNWMTGDNLYTHQLPRAGEECQGPLLRQHPDLADVHVPDDLVGEDAVLAWLAEQVARFGETRPVARLDPQDHKRIDPIDEFRMIAPGVPIIPVELEDDRG
jgi:hypothetical protein